MGLAKPIPKLQHRSKSWAQQLTHLCNHPGKTHIHHMSPPSEFQHNPFSCICISSGKAIMLTFPNNLSYPISLSKPLYYHWGIKQQRKIKKSKAVWIWHSPPHWLHQQSLSKISAYYLLHWYKKKTSFQPHLLTHFSCG